MPQTSWTFEEAHAHLDQALTQGPQTILREGHAAAVLVSILEWEQKTGRPQNLAEFFAASPLRGSGLVVERLTDGPRTDNFSGSLSDWFAGQLVSYLLDTNVISKWAKPEPHPGVIAWLARTKESLVFLSVITLAEVRHGIERMPLGIRRDWLNPWLREELPSRFPRSMLPIDAAIANAWGVLIAQSSSRSRPMQVIDAFLAANASVHGLILVTRSVSDFAALGLPVFDPWA